MNKYQSHKIVEAGRITAIKANDDGTYKVTLEDQPADVGLLAEPGDRILKMASLAGVALEGGWLVSYPDGYISWSPHEQFDGGYDLVQPSSGKSKIAGYRELNQTEINNINAVKKLGVDLGNLVDHLRLNEHADQRWCSIAATHLQQGLMALTRAIAKPDFF